MDSAFRAPYDTIWSISKRWAWGKTNSRKMKKRVQRPKIASSIILDLISHNASSGSSWSFFVVNQSDLSSSRLLKLFFVTTFFFFSRLPNDVVSPLSRNTFLASVFVKCFEWGGGRGGRRSFKFGRSRSRTKESSLVPTMTGALSLSLSISLTVTVHVRKKLVFARPKRDPKAAGQLLSHN